MSVSLNESIVEDAALTWFGELGYAVGHEPLRGGNAGLTRRRGERGASSNKFRFASVLFPSAPPRLRVNPSNP